MSTLSILAPSILAQPSDPGSGVFAVGGAIFIIFMIIALIATVFWIWMIIDVLTSNLPGPEKVLWFCVIFFLHLLGAIIYFVVARQGRASPQL